MTRLLIILSLVSLACIAPATLAVPAQPAATAAPTATATPVTYAAIGTVYIRDAAGVATGAYLAPGQAVQCTVDGDWCWIDDDRRVWAGCLEPNLVWKGCKER